MVSWYCSWQFVSVQKSTVIFFLFSICAILKTILSCQIKKTCYWCILKCEFVYWSSFIVCIFFKIILWHIFYRSVSSRKISKACMVTIKCLWDLLLLLCKCYILLFIDCYKEVPMYLCSLIYISHLFLTKVPNQFFSVHIFLIA